MLSSLADVRQAISAQLAADNLAAAIVQLNDTYLIDEREGIPGLDRVARFVSEVRSTVRDALGSDRTLVLHAGDYLSPSVMSLSLQGAQMVDLLGHCQ